jgi:hypothetical protein
VADISYEAGSVYIGPVGSIPDRSINVSSFSVGGVSFLPAEEDDSRIKELQDHIDAIMEVETAQKEALYEEIRKRDIMIQKVIDLHQADSATETLCRECLDILPCPTLQALGEA